MVSCWFLLTDSKGRNHFFTLPQNPCLDYLVDPTFIEAMDAQPNQESLNIKLKVMRSLGLRAINISNYLSSEDICSVIEDLFQGYLSSQSLACILVSMLENIEILYLCYF